MTVLLTVAVFTVTNIPGAICDVVSYFINDAPTEMS